MQYFDGNPSKTLSQIFSPPPQCAKPYMIAGGFTITVSCVCACVFFTAELFTLAQSRCFFVGSHSLCQCKFFHGLS